MSHPELETFVRELLEVFDDVDVILRYTRVLGVPDDEAIVVIDQVMPEVPWIVT